MRLLFLFCCLLGSVADSVAVDFPGTRSCHDDRLQVWLPEEFRNLTFWQVKVLDASGEGIEDCDYEVDYEKQTLTILYINCTKLENHKHHLRFRLQFNDTAMRDAKNATYDVVCDALQADEASRRSRFVSATNCTKDFMAVVFPRLIPSFHDEYASAGSRMEWVVSVEDGTQMHRLSLRQAMQQGYTFLMDGNRIIIQVAFDAAGVASYKQNGQVLYTVALKLTYGPPEQRLTVESRMICAPGPAVCNSTHMTVATPDFPGTLSAVSLDNRNIPLNQLQANGIGVDTRKGVKLYMSKRILKSQLYRDDYCSGFQLYASSLKLNFEYHGETVTMVTYPECPCEQNAPIVAVCTSDGYMDFEILSSSTKPVLNLDMLRLKDPTCKPVFQSPSNDVVRFRVPLNGCGTRQRFDGEKAIYENEVSATWADLPSRWISRDSEFRLTVMCYYGSDDASLDIKISSLSPPDSVVNQGPLSLILLIYPDSAYIVPYSDDQYPIVKYLRQPIFLEVQVLSRTDPNIHLMLDDCWATLSLDPASLPRWNVVVDGCDYEHDNYKTVFHPVSPSVSYSNFRQRFEVKAFAFVSDGKALPSLVYFHCSVLICDRFHPDSPLCSTSCPRSPSRNRRGFLVVKAVLLEHPSPTCCLPGVLDCNSHQPRLAWPLGMMVSSGATPQEDAKLGKAGIKAFFLSFVFHFLHFYIIQKPKPSGWFTKIKDANSTQEHISKQCKQSTLSKILGPIQTCAYTAKCLTAEEGEGSMQVGVRRAGGLTASPSHAPSMHSTCSSPGPALRASPMEDFLSADVAPADNSAIVTLPHAVILVPEEEHQIRGQQKWSDGKWITAVQVVGVTFGLVGTTLAVLALSKIKKRTVLIN